MFHNKGQIDGEVTSNKRHLNLLFQYVYWTLTYCALHWVSDGEELSNRVIIKSYKTTFLKGLLAGNGIKK